ncbi:MAG: DUF456 domain-containing protein [Anaerolineaceae bacterium]|nr:DUF456 domain-containing protein [Anaerolineaceae bacterium]
MNIGLMALQTIVLTIMLVGLVGLIIPIIPGVVIIWVAALIYGLVIGFDWIGVTLFVFITILMVAGNVIDDFMMGAGARQRGASWLSIVVAFVAAFVGTLVWPPIGGLLAALLGVFLVELIRAKELRKALDSMRGLATGCGWSFVVRFLIGLIMICWWFVWAFLVPLISGLWTT